MRLTESGDLLGVYSPTLRHHVQRSTESHALNHSAQPPHRHSSFDAVDGVALAGGRSSALGKRSANRYVPQLSRPLSDQHKALIIVIFFMVMASIFTALLKQW